MSEPGSDIGFGCKEMQDCFCHPVTGFYTVLHYTEPSKINLIFCEMKFLWVEDNAVVATAGNIVHCVPKWCFYGVIQEYAIVNKLVFLDYIDGYIVDSTNIYIWWCVESLWGPNSLPHSVMNIVASHEARERRRIWHPCHASRTVSLVYRQHRGVIKWRLGMVGLPHGSNIELLQVYHAPGWAVLFKVLRVSPSWSVAVGMGLCWMCWIQNAPTSIAPVGVYCTL